MRGADARKTQGRDEEGFVMIVTHKRTIVRLDPALTDALAHARFRERRDVEVRQLLDHTPRPLRVRAQWTLWAWERDDAGRWT